LSHAPERQRRAGTEAVQLSVKEYTFLIEELEMKEDIALYEKVKADKNESYMPLTDYLKKRKKK